MSTPIKIDKNVPRPVRQYHGRPKGQSKYPFVQMEEVGDSFFVSADTRRKRSQFRLQQSLTSLALMFRKRVNADARFSTSQVEEEGIKGVRVWRVAKEEK